MNQIIYEIDGIKYLYFSYVCNSLKTANKIENCLIKYGGIQQSFSVRYSIFHGTKITVNMLVPEMYALKFSNELL